jgi:hypothetical protein
LKLQDAIRHECFVGDACSEVPRFARLSSIRKFRELTVDGQRVDGAGGRAARCARNQPKNAFLSSNNRFQLGLRVEPIGLRM